MADLKSMLSVGSDVESEGDFLPTGKSFILDSGVYDMSIDMAYLKIAASGAMMLMVNFKDVESGTMVRSRFIMTSGTAKGGKNYYLTKDGKKRLLPDMAKVDQLCEIVLGNGISSLLPEDKTIKLWSFADSKEVPTEVPVYIDLLGKVLKVGIQRCVTNKTKPSDSGKWVPTNDKREFNEAAKFFNEDGQTLTEQRAGADGEFITKWADMNDGKIQDTFKPVEGAAPAGETVTPAVSPAKPLFT